MSEQEKREELKFVSTVMIIVFFVMMGAAVSLGINTFLDLIRIFLNIPIPKSIVINWLDGIIISFILSWLRTYINDEQFLVVRIDPKNNESKITFFGPKQKVTKTKED